ncbi:MAG: transcription-repair coupling factor, partial [Oscillospiraceae bacterium]|nr:transcription-repair coupling factor [Oscillospiraceae bacterium]
VYPFAKFAVFTGRQGAAAGVKKARKKGKGLTSLEDLKPGDYVVHQTHGIGQYLGIERLDLQGVVKDYLKLAYEKGDTLYVPVTQLDIVSRYTAPGDSEKVKLARLGSAEWGRTRSRVKKAAAEMAEELIALYARRNEAKGFAFPPDDDWQRNFETRFEYDETEDQLTSAEEIKRDMEKPHPMDRLLCGDVGVGKTEVALRAAFKCMMGGKQCAILVPTTILAWQHYNTILRRMESFPVRVELLSRFRSPKQQKETLRNLADGTADIVVGTHRLLQNDIHFKDLGLVIIDEEQRFGVKHKEKLKENFLGVDVLTLSATPIPRTLNMAMSGIRDMSSIEQPPVERQPIETYVMEYDPQVVKGALLKELGRAGQVYYLHNRIDSIEACAQRVAAMAPAARVAVAHGRMTEEQLSRVWRQVLDGEVDILVCTTIIETGVDVRNCNTLIIEDADRMGLAQLYQIRGRVGRSGRKAYAYFTFQPDKVLTDVAAKRLSAIREFTSFGSGLRIAMRDLQIRGVGSLLGQSQHGHMQAVGYDLYMKILGQAVAEAKGEAAPPDKAECLIDVRADAYLPEKYISSTEGRIEAYKRIAAIESQADAEDVLAELCDRYGEPSASARGLVDISLARVQAAGLGIYEIVQRQDALIFYSDRLKLDEIKPMLRSLDRRIMVNASAKPYLSARILPGEKPLSAMSLILDKMCENSVKPALKTGQSPLDPV